MSNPLEITIEEVASRIKGGIPAEDKEWGQMKVDEAVREILRRIPDMAKRIADGRIDRDYVIDKIAQAFLRVFRNEDNIYQSETEGDYSYRINVRAASPDVWFTTDEWWGLGWVDPQKAPWVPRTVLTKTTRRNGWSEF